MGAVAGGGGHVGGSGPLPAPGLVVLADAASVADAEGQQRLLAALGVDHAAHGDGRPDDAEVALPARVEAADAPQLPPRAGVVAGEVVAAGDDDLLAGGGAQHGGGGVRVGRLPGRVRGPLDPPGQLAGGGVEGGQIRRVVGAHPVQDLHDQAAVVQGRRRGVTPHETEGPELGLQVPPPDRSALHVEGGDDAGAGHGPDVAPVGDRRRRGVVVLAPGAVALGEDGAPQLLAVGTRQTQQQQVVAARITLPPAALPGGLGLPGLRRRRRRDEDAVAPDDGGAAAPRGQRALPDDALGGAPLRGQAGGGADPVLVGAAPLGPVLRRGNGADGGQQDAGDQGSHGMAPALRFWWGRLRPKGKARASARPGSPIDLVAGFCSEGYFRAATETDTP